MWTDSKPENKEVEQRWFVGAHSNVGGGSEVKPPDCLADLGLLWMQDKAESRGLKLRSKAEVKPEYCKGEIEDSYGKFVFGVYRWFNKSYSRPYGKGVNETVDASVWQRWDQVPEYRPGSLLRQREPAATQPS